MTIQGSPSLPPLTLDDHVMDRDGRRVFHARRGPRLTVEPVRGPLVALVLGSRATAAP